MKRRHLRLALQRLSKIVFLFRVSIPCDFCNRPYCAPRRRGRKVFYRRVTLSFFGGAPFRSALFVTFSGEFTCDVNDDQFRFRPSTLEEMIVKRLTRDGEEREYAEKEAGGTANARRGKRVNEIRA